MTVDNTNTGAVPLGPNGGNALERVQMQRLGFGDAVHKLKRKSYG